MIQLTGRASQPLSSLVSTLWVQVQIFFILPFLILLCALCYPILKGMHYLKLEWFIPYSSNNYILLSGIDATSSFPLHVLGIISIPFNDANGLLVFIWLFFVAIQLHSIYFDWLQLRPKSKKPKLKTIVTYYFKLKNSLKFSIKIFIIYTIVLIILCFFGMRKYDVLTFDGYLRYQNYFSLQEEKILLSNLIEFNQLKYGKGILVWILKFSDGTIYNIPNMPTRAAIALLMQQPAVQSNFIKK